MSSSGLIYAVIVGAWAAYLVPMWLRRQDELNEARPTERFSTAIRLLSGRAAMERRYAKSLRTHTDEDEPGTGPDAAAEPEGPVDARAFAMPADAPRDAARGEIRDPERPETRAPERVETAPDDRAERNRGAARGDRDPQRRAEGRDAAARRPVRRNDEAAVLARARRSKVLARRRRTTVVLFLAFTLSAVAAAVLGLAYLWLPALPALLLSSYIVYLRAHERRRFVYTMDRRRAEDAARQLRERRGAGRRGDAEPGADEEPADPGDPGLSALAAGRRALVEQTDHAEWVDQQRERERGPARGDSWDPVPVPLPTYVTAPVAPRATGSVDLGAPDAWSSARSSTAESARDREAAARRAAEQRRENERRDALAEEEAAGQEGEARGNARSDGPAPVRRSTRGRARERGRTPLFDQYDEGDRPRAANE
ncbi:hypothetical protein DSC45_18980 [Streptomyces sp. YIM 130001]|uniref:divisome protein SepX/GlpR n=1 Tax=Streptomyces sp. YIM 130001 TaxID=2259644 RepID=UPI000E64D5CD|nr:gephyrin-like molybdotransferase receptor GlpR [Streptomyces sp. YIM 130001]RII14982.1 hypothetical protein DSC45_18980 [Streptomyces sp. YIM 130001]